MKSPFNNAVIAAGLLLGVVEAVAQAQTQGGAQLWLKRYHAGDSQAYAVVVDGAGKVFVTGISAYQGGTSCATVAYSNTGVPLWTNRLGNSIADLSWAFHIAADTNGNVFVAATEYATVPDTNGAYYVTVAYSAAGLPLWTNRYIGSLTEGLAVDRDGNVFVTGYAGNDNGTYDYATVAYSGAGVPLWTNRYPDGLPSGIAVDTNGNVFVTGGTRSSAINSAVTLAYSNGGIPLWTNIYNGPGSTNDGASSIAVDRSDNVVVSGSATIEYSGTGVPLWTNETTGSAFALDRSGNVYVMNGPIVALSGDGVPLWTNNFNGSGSGIAVDRAGNVFATGASAGVGGKGDFATVAYSSGGVPLWTNRYNGPLNSYDGATAIAVDPDGDVIVTGYSGSPDAGYDYVTIKYSSSIPPVILDFQRLNNQLVLTWTNSGFNLQSAPASVGTFTNIPGATSPYTNFVNAPQQFFRLISN